MTICDNALNSFELTSRNLQWVFSDLIGTKFKLNETNRFVRSTSSASNFCSGCGMFRFSSSLVFGSILYALSLWNNEIDEINHWRSTEKQNSVTKWKCWMKTYTTFSCVLFDYQNKSTKITLNLDWHDNEIFSIWMSQLQAPKYFYYYTQNTSNDISFGLHSWQYAIWILARHFVFRISSRIQFRLKKKCIANNDLLCVFGAYIWTLYTTTTASYERTTTNLQNQLSHRKWPFVWVRRVQRSLPFLLFCLDRPKQTHLLRLGTIALHNGYNFHEPIDFDLDESTFAF